MRKNNRNLSNQKMNRSDKVIFYSGIAVAIVLAIIIGTLVYANNLQNKQNEGMIGFEEIAVVENKVDNKIESASTQIGKTIKEVEEEDGSKVVSHKDQESDEEKDSNEKSESESKSEDETKKSSNIKDTKVVEPAKKVETNEIKELVFETPVQGEVIRGFAKDNLVYSETLEEWVTHLGIDIKADKTTVVKAAEAGVIKTIKNDPRYGLTVVVEHNNKYQTVYSNLLTSEFVVEGEKVEKGQSIGTVGNTAPFEIADAPHLHFEILENSIQVDPMLYLK